MLGGIAGAPSRIQWSAYNDPTATWGQDRLTQAGYADLTAEFGEVQKIVGGRYAIVFQQRGIQRLSYVGPPLIWNAQTVSEDRGAVAAHSVVTVGYNSYFLSQDGFYVTNGSSVEPIATQRVNKWFYERVDQSAISETHGTVDWQNECIVWAFRSPERGYFDNLLIYSWAQNRWSSGSVPVDWLTASQVSGTDIDSIDALYGALDDIPISLDSQEFAPKQRVLAAFMNSSRMAPYISGTSWVLITGYWDDAGMWEDSSIWMDADLELSVYTTFSGPPLEATLQTGQFQPGTSRFAYVTEVHPLINSVDWDAEIQVLGVDQRNQWVSSDQKAVGWGGFAPVRAYGQKLSVRMVKPSGSAWEDAQGVQVKYRAEGRR